MQRGRFGARFLKMLLSYKGLDLTFNQRVSSSNPDALTNEIDPHAGIGSDTVR
jgi:hypothetical protein